MNVPHAQLPAARQRKSTRHFISGLGSGVTSAIILQPLDLLKTRVQQSRPSSFYECWHELRKSQSPWRSLWRGTIPSALRTGFGSALYFSSLNAIRQYVSETEGFSSRLRNRSGSTALPTLSNSANLISGAVARTFAGFVLMPLTVIKVRFESNLYNYPSVYSAAKDIARREGFRGFFSGFGATAIRDAPYAGMYVLFYEILKTRMGSIVLFDTPEESRLKSMSASLASSINFSSAIIAGAACSAISNPFDVVKTRIQLQPQTYRNIGHAWYRMVSEEGFRSLWNGLVLRMSRKALSSALAWTVYEELIRRFAGV